MSVGNHYAAGFALGVLMRWLPRRVRERRALQLDDWGWNREVLQHDPELSPHQVAEAHAWGDGYRVAAGLPPRG